jgi:signal transduction histidine kinase
MVTTYGDRPADVRTLPITYRGAAVGRLVLPARGVRSRLTTRDEQLLGDLVRQAATAVRTSQLAAEVQQSRERLVTAREEERRRIRRDLHDGLGPALSGVVFQLDAARMAVDDDPGAAKQQLAGISEHVQSVVADVRRLVHDLRPPALDDRGLVGAIRQQADRLEVPLAITAPELDGRLPAAVEVAAYRIAGEALTNVARHADATAATLTLDLTDDA